MKKSVLLSLAAVLLSCPFAFAEEGMGMDMGKEPTKEQRAKMAEHHEKMAACLRSDKTMKECHEQMKKACEESGSMCPGMGGGHGHMRGMMKDKSKDSSGQKK